MMNLPSIISAAADEADGFLGGVTSPNEAKPLIVEWLTDNQPGLTAPDRQQVVQGLLALLEREGFFAGTNARDSRSDAAGEREAE